MDYPLKQWKTRPVGDGDVDALSSSLNISRTVAEILQGRGIIESADADRFLNPRLSEIADPFTIPGVRDAASIVWDSIEAGHRITVFGDYDVDGVTSTALLVSVLRKLGAEVQPFLPERELDGYGMSMGTLERCIEESDPQLIITVDCGTNSVEAVSYALSEGIQVVVTDHHEPQSEISQPSAIVNPKVAGDEDANPLAGVGVAFRLCHGLIKEGRERDKAVVSNLDLRDWMDYVAVGTVADIVPLRGENRVLVKHGLSRLNTQMKSGEAKPCWQAIAEAASVKGAFETYHIGFVIGPRLNASGRLGSALPSLQFLLSEDYENALKSAKQLDNMNVERRSIEAKISASAMKIIDGYFDPEKDFGLVVWSRGWHKGINGIVASRLSSKYQRPVVVISIDENGRGTGSSRSIECMNILDVLNGCSDVLSSHGGHKMAAGLEIQEDMLDAFKAKFNKLCAEILSGSDLRSTLEVDAWLSLSEIDERLYEDLKKIEPFGIDNPAPVLGVRGVNVVGQPKKIGKSGAHLKMVVAAGGKQIDAIGFGLGAYDVPEGPLDIVFKLKDNTYMGRTSLQMHIDDISAHGS